MKNLKLHSKIHTQYKALEAVIESVKPLAMAELKKIKDNKTTVNGVDYCLTKGRPALVFVSEEVKAKYAAKVQKITDKFIEDGLLELKSKETICAKIPNSTKENIFARASSVYKKYFKVK